MSIFASYYLRDLSKLDQAMREDGYRGIAHTYNEHVYFQGIYLAVKGMCNIEYALVDTLINVAKSDRRCYMVLANTISNIIKTDNENLYCPDMVDFFFERLVESSSLLQAFEFINKEDWVNGNDIWGISKVIGTHDFITYSRIFEYICNEYEDSFAKFKEESANTPQISQINKCGLICAHMEEEYTAMLEGVYDLDSGTIIDILDRISAYCKVYDYVFDDDDRAKIGVGISKIANDAGLTDFESIYQFKLYADKVTSLSYDIDLGDDKVIIEDLDRSEIIVEIPKDGSKSVDVQLSNGETIVYPVDGLKKIKEGYAFANNVLTPLYIVDNIRTGVNNMLSVSNKIFDRLIDTYTEMDLEAFMDTCATLDISGLPVVEKLAILDVYFAREKNMLNDRRIFDEDLSSDVKYYKILRPLVSFYTDRDDYSVTVGLNKGEYEEMETQDIINDESFTFV